MVGAAIFFREEGRRDLFFFFFFFGRTVFFVGNLLRGAVSGPVIHRHRMMFPLSYLSPLGMLAQDTCVLAQDLRVRNQKSENLMV